MPELTNMPDKTKYTPGDAVFIFDLDKVKIKPVTISEWRVEMDNPLNDTTGRQIIYYKFEEVPYEIQEKYVFASENHCLSFLKNDYINRAIESGSGGEGLFKSGLNLAGDARSFGNWTDFAGLDMQGANFVISDEPVLRTGTASISGTAVTGSGTLFLSEYQIGDTFEMFNGFDDPLELGVTIASITDDTHMTLSSAPGNQSGLRVGIILETYGRSESKSL